MGEKQFLRKNYFEVGRGLCLFLKYQFDISGFQGLDIYRTIAGIELGRAFPQLEDYHLETLIVDLKFSL